MFASILLHLLENRDSRLSSDQWQIVSSLNAVSPDFISSQGLQDKHKIYIYANVVDFL